MNSLHFYRQNNNTKKNLLSNANSYFTANVKEPEYKCVNYNLHENHYLQRSFSADNVVIRSRGFKPSDIRDPAKRHFLENLTTKILHVDMDGGETKRIDLQKLLTPAQDSNELYHAKNKKMYASSYFYAPSHPTVEDQVELARRISHSLSDVKNLQSKGQSMYVNRKKRSVKWIHDGNGVDGEEEPSSPIHKDKIPLKCMMNPNGKVLDIHGIQALGEEVNIEERPSNPEKLFDIVRDLNNQKGRGAEIFAKRRKKSEKWVVDKNQVQTPTTPGLPKIPIFPSKQETDVKENSVFPPFKPLPISTPATPAINTNNNAKPFYNPFTLDLSLDYTPTITGNTFVQFPRDVGFTVSKSSEAKNNQQRETDVRQYATEFDMFEERFENSNNVNGRSAHGTWNRPCNGQPQTFECNKQINIAFNGIANQNNNYSDDQSIKTTNNNNNNVNNNNNNNDDEYEIAEGEAGDYTPIPVKQLIREFEKTCRPPMQYKHISPKIIPQLYPVDNDIARYFKTYAAIKCDQDLNKKLESTVESYEQISDKQACNYYARDSIEVGRNGCDPGGDGVNDGFGETERQRDWRLKYIDENNESDADSEDEDIFEGDDGMTGNRSLPYDDVDADCYRNQMTSQLCENGYENGSDNNYINPEADISVDAKSLVLALVASEEDILKQIKKLRHTPVLDNLIPTVPPECRFDDVYRDEGKKLYENKEYQGPKLNSYQTLSNYNTAPRGWDQAHTYYRPITFGKPQNPIVYSDF